MQIAVSPGPCNRERPSLVYIRDLVIKNNKAYGSSGAHRDGGGEEGAMRRSGPLTEFEQSHSMSRMWEGLEGHSDLTKA